MALASRRCLADSVSDEGATDEHAFVGAARRHGDPADRGVRTVRLEYGLGPAALGPCAVLPANNIWNTPVDTLPVLSNSASMVTTIGASTGFHADFGSGTWDGGPIGIPFVTVAGTQTNIPRRFSTPTKATPDRTPCR